MSTDHFDVLVIGSGPGGYIAALWARARPSSKSTTSAARA